MVERISWEPFWPGPVWQLGKASSDNPGGADANGQDAQGQDVATPVADAWREKGDKHHSGQDGGGEVGTHGVTQPEVLVVLRRDSEIGAVGYGNHECPADPPSPGLPARREKYG